MENIYISIKCNRSFVLDWLLYSSISRVCDLRHKAGLWPHAVGHRLDPAVRQQDAVLARDGVSVTLLLLVEVVPDVILHSVPKSVWHQWLRLAGKSGIVTAAAHHGRHVIAKSG